MNETTQTEGGVLGTPPAADGVKPGDGKDAKAADAVVAEGTKVADAAVETPEQKAAFEAKVAEAIKTRDEKAAAESKTKTETEKAAAAKAWADFKPKLPEGMKLNEAEMKEFLPLAQKHLKPEAAQEFIDFNLKREAARAAAGEQGLTDERAGWFKDLKADKEFGGQKYEATVKEANKAFEKFADADALKFLKATGLDAHPGLMKAFARIGAAMRDDNIGGTQNNGTTKTAEQALAGLYRKNSPGMFPKS